jgi:uncharacterized protein
MKLKWSVYTEKFTDKDNIYLYKSTNGALFRLKLEEWMYINEYLDKGTTINEDTKKHLAELYMDGIIVDASLNEYKLFQLEYKRKITEATSGVIYFSPSLKCNLQCKYCLIGEEIELPNAENVNEMSREDVIQSAKWIIEVAKHHHIRNVTVILYGGEPMLSHNSNMLLINTLNEIRIDDLEIGFKLITNGYGFDRNQILELKDIGIKSIQITLDGPPEIHNSRRYGANKAKTFDTIINNALFLTSLKVNIIIRINVDNTNVTYLKDLIDILHKHNLQKYAMLHFNLVDPSNFSSDSGYNEETTSSFSDIYKYAFEKGFNIGKWRRYCSLNSKYFFTIAPNGDIYKCSNFINIKDRIIGNIYTGIPKDDLAGEINENCLKCVHVGHCNGGCEVMRQTSNIGKNYCFKKENYAMTKAYLSARYSEEYNNRMHLNLLLKQANTYEEIIEDENLYTT